MALRMGADGALVASECAPEPVHIPAADVNVVDVTGCGNAFNGGLLAALQRGHSLTDAGAWGAAAASCMAEAEGEPPATSLVCTAEAACRPLWPSMCVYCECIQAGATSNKILARTLGNALRVQCRLAGLPEYATAQNGTFLASLPVALLTRRCQDVRRLVTARTHRSHWLKLKPTVIRARLLRTAARI